MREIGQLSGEGALFQAIVFGYCPATRRFGAYTINPITSHGSMSVDIAEEDLSQDAVVIIGSKPDRFRARIAEIRTADVHPVVFADAPRRALRAIVGQEDQGSTVGGTLQYGWVTPAGFELVADVVPRRPPLSGLNTASLVLGFDMYSFGQVGPYAVGIVGRH
jgi:hypothetical protein